MSARYFLLHTAVSYTWASPASKKSYRFVKIGGNGAEPTKVEHPGDAHRFANQRDKFVETDEAGTPNEPLQTRGAPIAPPRSYTKMGDSPDEAAAKRKTAADEAAKGRAANEAAAKAKEAEKAEKADAEGDGEEPPKKKVRRKKKSEGGDDE